MKKKLLIIDDEINLVETLKDYFSLKGYLVHTSDNGVNALEQLSVEPDLILLDVSMPEMDGIAFCKKVRAIISVPIIFLSAKIDEASRLEGLMAGGDDYLIKPFSLPELEVRVAAHLRREERGKDKKRSQYFGELLIQYDENKVSVQDVEIEFTKTEFSILAFLSLHKGQAYSREQIYEHLWGFDKEGNADILTEHIRRIRSKLKKNSEHEFIQTVWGIGYKWIG